MRWRSGVATLLVAALAGGGLLACGEDEPGGAERAAADGGKVLDTKTAGVLLVGSDIPYIPFEFGKPPDYDGFDMDLMREVTKRLTVKLQVQKTPFDTIFRDLAQGRFDMVVSSVTITDDREKVVDFSLPYFNADLSLMVKKGSSVRSMQDLAGKRIGVQLGGTGEEYAKKELTASQPRTYDVIGDAFNALAAGQVDAVINDYPSSKYAEREYPTLEVVETIPTGEQYGLVYPKEATELRTRIDDVLRELKRDGTFDRIYREWFATDSPAELLR
jgi:ABC-type amino acid transport substrate-binding protein